MSKLKISEPRRDSIHWRVTEDFKANLAKEAKRRGFDSLSAFLNSLIASVFQMKGKGK